MTLADAAPPVASVHPRPAGPGARHRPRAWCRIRPGYVQTSRL